MPRLGPDSPMSGSPGPMPWSPDGSPDHERGSFKDPNGEWAFVGEGRGSYQVVQQFVYVGEGQGSISFEQACGKQRKWKAMMCLGFYYAVISMVLVCLLVGLVFLVPSVQSMISSALARHSSVQRRSALEIRKGTAARVDCSLDHPVSTWSVERRRWCCRYKKVGCASFSSCNVESDAGRANWSDFKRNWCCHYRQTGCQNVTQSSTTTPEAKLKDALPYNCAVGYSDWRQAWPRAKQRFCCKYGGLGCASEPTETTSSRSPDCDRRSGGRGCHRVEMSTTRRTSSASARTSSAVSPTTSSRPPAASEATRHEGPTTSAAPQSSASTEASAQATRHVRPTTSAAPQSSASTKAAAQAKPKFNCTGGRQSKWPIQQKFWCCEYGNVCPERVKQTLV
mmetsp:Transcript_7392/g.19973  ORF Transcript_7392/g.19973 Transcript_7392/m.19973 type:complete len:395 (-) Transcript_7392:148-1332(-)